MNNRIRQLRKYLKMSQEDFGEKLGLAKSGISNIENGTRNLTERNIKLICAEFNVDYDWIKFGIGEMFRENNHSDMAAIDAIMVGENEFAKKLFKEFANLSQEEWKLLEKIMTKIVKKTE